MKSMKVAHETRGSIVLSANVPHYYYTALALQEANLLKRYIYPIGIRNGNLRIGRLLPKQLQKRLLGHDVSGIEEQFSHSIPWTEILQKSLPRTGLLTPERSNWIFNHVHDYVAQFSVCQSDVFHYVSSIGLYSARRAKRNGSILVCDVRTAFPDHEREVIREEYHLLGLPFHPPGLLYDTKIKKEYSISDYFVVPSTYAMSTFVDAGFDKDRIFVLPYGVELHKDANLAVEGESRYSRNTFRIISVGQVIPRKGIHYLIEAFNMLDEPDSELLIVGPVSGSMESYVKTAQTMNPRIRILGQIPWIRLRGYYEASSVFVLPSISDSWGLVVTEAMSTGLPVIVTENTGSKDAVQDGHTGFVIPIRDAESIANRLRILFRDAELARRMGQKAKHSAKEYTWQRYGERLVSIYEKILR